MLPSKISRDILGVKHRRDSAPSETTQLLGRSRNERLLDGFYNRQSRKLREAERHKQEQKLRLNLFSKKQCHYAQKRNIKQEEHIKSEKSALPTCKEENKATKATFSLLQTDVIISNLIKHATNSKKLCKVIPLISQLLQTSSTENQQKNFMHLFCAVALSSSTASLPPVTRQAAIALGKSLTSVCYGSQEPKFDDLNLSLCADIDYLNKYMNESVSLHHWISILQLPVIWSNSLYTDDTFQFHHSLAHFACALDSLPCISFYTPYSEPLTLKTIVSSMLSQDVSSSCSGESVTEEHVVYNSENVKPVQDTTLTESGDALESQDKLMQEDQYSLPSRHIAYSLQKQFILAALPIFFEFSKTRWCRSAVSKFFYDLYLDRNKKFSPLEATKIEAWQSQIRQKILDTSEFTKNSVQKVGEAAYSVRDGRDERIIAVHGAAVWSSKQTGS